MSQPMNSKYTACQVNGCDNEICCYGHIDERYCSEHMEEYEKFCEFMRRYEEGDIL